MTADTQTETTSYLRTVERESEKPRLCYNWGKWRWNAPLSMLAVDECRVLHFQQRLNELNTSQDTYTTGYKR